MTPLRLSPEVERALARGAPLVALESTIVAHGMPPPQNLETARSLEAIVRDAGATPATIAVLDGTVRAGLDAPELERVAREPMLKLGAADLAFAVATGASGATTVAATALIAARAGIEVFATGGIGGVHRGAQTSLDVSGDLDAIARAPVVVVCAGAKAILDLPKTLEALETRGIPVAGFRTNEFPAFWTARSGLPLALRVDSAAEAAALLRAQRALGLHGGVVVANPIAREDEIPAGEIEKAIATAIADAAAAGIAGKAVTPWLLDRVLALTGSRSLAANVSLARANARLAAEIAVALRAP